MITESNDCKEKKNIAADKKRVLQVHQMTVYVTTMLSTGT